MARPRRTAGQLRSLRGVAVMTALVMTALALTVPVAPTPAAAQAETETAATPNPVITWNTYAQTAIYEVGHQSPTATTRSFAMVQGAVYDAVNAIAGTPYEPYLLAPRARPSDSTPAAVAAAAYRVLVWRFPDQADWLRARYDQSLATIPDGPAKLRGIAVGEAAAAAMIQARRDDGADANAKLPWIVGTEPGQWRPTPPDYLNVSAGFAFVTPFVVPDAGAYRLPGPPALTSAAYTADFNEIKAVGSATAPPTVRSDDQTEAARWWDDLRMVEWEITRQLATTHRLDTLQTARLLAMVDLAVVDAAIACYKHKYHWSFWRPVTAIWLAGTDGNPATVEDPYWEPLKVTHPSTEYPSGHACNTAATVTALRTFFGRDDLSFSAYSADSDTTRHYDSLSAAMAELVEARVWAGLHFRTAAVDGRTLGAAVARDVLSRSFRPRGNG